LTTGINDTGGNFATGVNDTSGKIAAGINDTGGKFATGINDTGGKLCHQFHYSIVDTGCTERPCIFSWPMVISHSVNEFL
jgi:hypothetical protein